MKKTLMIVLALVLAVSLLAACTQIPSEDAVPEDQEQAVQEALDEADQTEALVEDDHQ